MSLPPTRQYDEIDVARWISARTLNKAKGYANAVAHLEVGPTWITSTVQGTAIAPYLVRIDFVRDRASGYSVAMHCSCPVGYACKHVAATLLAALAGHDRAPTVNPAVLRWAESLGAAARRAAKPKPARAPKAAEGIHYVIEWAPLFERYHLYLLKGRFDHGRPTPGTTPWQNLERALVQPPQFVREEDLAIFRLLRRATGRLGYWEGLALDGDFPGEALALIRETGRAWFATASASRRGSPSSDREFSALHGATERSAGIAWLTDDYGQTVPRLVATPPAPHVLPVSPPWFVDPDAGEMGPLDCGGHAESFRRVLELPPLSPVDLPVVAHALADACPGIAPPMAPDGSGGLALIDSPPTPLLKLASAPVWYVAPHRGYRGDSHATHYDYALPRMRYGEAVVGVAETGEYFVTPGGGTLRVKRRRKEEADLVERLAHFGLKPPPRRALHANRPLPEGILGLESEAAWTRFFADVAPKLRTAGWELEVDPGFRHHVLEVDGWEAAVSEGEGGWLDVDLGIVVEGRRLPLAPLLHDLFARDARWLDPKAAARIDDAESLVVVAPDGKRLRLPAGRIKPLALTLIDLFDTPSTGALRLSPLEAPRLTPLAQASEWRLQGMESVQRLAQRIEGAASPRPVVEPPAFGLALRPYQREGLGWLQYLRTHALAGILADDMGLGKTAQTLAHLLLEKEAGRLDQPALVVLPTSLVYNWRREAARCAPALRVLSLHGKTRAQAFPRIPEHDVCLTTYPLLWRDEETLASHHYHYLILDEAQVVKNAASRAAAVVRRLRARHRLCLTGTPLENHLGELWSQFDFLLPGFLGDARQFASTWRTPIEKRGDALRRDLLARRVRPFILRRRKEDVARELPPKTVIVRAVELEEGQRDLYETVRSAMDVRVRDEIAAKGFNRSQIVILDALLKLRQVCCDPRLLKTAAAQRVKERAKLALLMEMLPELVAEGRRILLFSQFTSMLALIREELDRAGIACEQLTGQTRNREAVVDRFQRGTAPVFLISLKAGGVGLNLTAADTVIHFDPWWNPAVENQATDRAHRIGQKRKVFVYKLVVAGSIEEKILALQEKKADLAAGVLAEDGEALAKFSEADIRALLEPLPGR